MILKLASGSALHGPPAIRVDLQTAQNRQTTVSRQARAHLGEMVLRQSGHDLLQEDALAGRAGRVEAERQVAWAKRTGPVTDPVSRVSERVPRVTHQHAVQDDPQTPNINGGTVVGVPREEFWSGVLQTAAISLHQLSSIPE
jgi:hypothetical protein